MYSDPAAMTAYFKYLIESFDKWNKPTTKLYVVSGRDITPLTAQINNDIVCFNPNYTKYSQTKSLQAMMSLYKRGFFMNRNHHKKVDALGKIPPHSEDFKAQVLKDISSFSGNREGDYYGVLLAMLSMLDDFRSNLKTVMYDIGLFARVIADIIVEYADEDLPFKQTPIFEPPPTPRSYGLSR